MMVVSIPAGKESVDWHSAEVQYNMGFFFSGICYRQIQPPLKNLNPTKLYYCFTASKLLRQREYPAAKTTIDSK